jgi:hypothetical protein
MSSPLSLSTLGAHLNFGRAARFMAEPTTRTGSAFSSIMSGTTAVISRVAGALTGGASKQFPGLEGDYANLIQQQIEQQKQLQLMTFFSNTEKSKHETQMTALRNIRVG